MNAKTLRATAQAMVPAGRGILAADESTGTIRDARKLDPDYGASGIVVDGDFDLVPAPTRVQKSALALMELVEDLLDYGRIEADEIQLEPRPFRIRALLADVGAMLSVLSRPTPCPPAPLPKRRNRRAHRP